MLNLIITIMNYGYARVSTRDQHLEPQIDQLIASGCDKVIKEKAGAMKERPELIKLLAKVTPGDVITVVKLDRLGRSLRHLITIIDELKSKGVQFISLSDNINTTTPQGRLIFNIFSSIAEFERELISERTKAGLNAVRRRGTVLGRPTGLSKSGVNNKVLAIKYKEEGMKVVDICKQIGISKPTYYRYLQ